MQNKPQTKDSSRYKPSFPVRLISFFRPKSLLKGEEETGKGTEGEMMGEISNVGMKQTATVSKTDILNTRVRIPTDNSVSANFDSHHLTIGAGVAIFHLATSRVVVCWHSVDEYWFLPKGRRDVNEDTSRGAEREGYEEVTLCFLNHIHRVC